MKKVKTYLEAKPSFTKYCSRRLEFPTIKIFVNVINEIWSVDQAYDDKLAICNRGVEYLLVAFDCFSRHLRVEPLKTNHGTETAHFLKKMIKHKQPE